VVIKAVLPFGINASRIEVPGMNESMCVVHSIHEDGSLYTACDESMCYLSVDDMISCRLHGGVGR